MGRGGKTWVKMVLPVKTGWKFMNQSFFPFATRNFKNRNMLLNILILMMILALKSIKMKETAVNYSIWVEWRLTSKSS